MNINFEQDQTESLTNINDAKTLSDQVVKLKDLKIKYYLQEDNLKKLKQALMFFQEKSFLL
jgi:hypothetical protein